MWTKERMNKLKKAIRALVFTAGFVCIFLSLTKLMQYKTAISRIPPFFEIEEPVDVMFFGTSHVSVSVLPYELWNDYGISSYNFGNNATRIPLTCWLIKNVLDYQTPKLIVLDCSYLSSDTKTSTTLQQAHKVLDSFPLTKNKRAAIADLFEEENQLEFLWPFSIYHNRWNELTKADFSISYNTSLGATPQIKVSAPAVFKQLPSGTTISRETLAMQYIGELIDYCRERDIEVLLTYIPSPASERRQKEGASTVALAKQYGVEAINFLELNDVVNYETDCDDADSHLNASGAQKITSYLGSYIVSHYEISDHRNETQFSSWNKGYETYLEQKAAQLKKQKLLSSYLMLLADDAFSGTIYVRKDSVLLQHTRIAPLLDNAAAFGKDTQVCILSDDAFALQTEGASDGDIVICVSRADNGNPVDTACFTVTKNEPLALKRTK